MTFDALSDVNFLAAAAAAIAYFVLGAIWHAPPVFGKAWQKATGVEMEGASSPSPAMFAINLVAYFLFAVVIAAIAKASGTDTLGEGLVLGVFIAVGFAIPMTAVIALYERKPDPLAYTLINGIYNALGSIVMAVIIGIWS